VFLNYKLKTLQLNFWWYFTTVIEFLVQELTTRFSTFHLMDAMGIYYLEYWLQVDVEENFNHHLMLTKSHYYYELHLELVKSSKANIPLKATRICPSINYTQTYLKSL
jgi:hypothetical protein